MVSISHSQKGKYNANDLQVIADTFSQYDVRESLAKIPEDADQAL